LEESLQLFELDRVDDDRLPRPVGLGGEKHKLRVGVADVEQDVDEVFRLAIGDEIPAAKPADRDGVKSNRDS
jgi:hypothetical protein